MASLMSLRARESEAIGSAMGERTGTAWSSDTLRFFVVSIIRGPE